MKSLPSLRPATLLTVAVVLSACSTPANRRELYNTSYNESGSWHDYTRRREAEQETGTIGGPAPTVLPNRPVSNGATPVVPGAPGALPAGATEPGLQAPLSPSGVAPAPANVPPPAEVAPAPIPGTDTPAPTTDAAATPAPQ